MTPKLKLDINGWKFWEYFDASSNQWCILEKLRDTLNQTDKRSSSNGREIKNEILVCKGRGAVARGKWIGEQFFVLKGSKVNVAQTPSQPSTNKKNRERVLKEGALLKENDYLVFAHDYPFRSLTAAAGVVLGRSANGKIEWRSSTI